MTTPPRRTTRSVIERELTPAQARVLRRRFGLEGAADDEPPVRIGYPPRGDGGAGGTPAPAFADPPEPRRRGHG